LRGFGTDVSDEHATIIFKVEEVWFRDDLNY
jgi:hypothetical protein